MNQIKITTILKTSTIAHKIVRQVLCVSLLILYVLAATAYSVTMQMPEFFSVDPNSPIVTVHGMSPADIFDPVLYHASGPPPEGLCRSASDFGLAVGDNVDAISIPEPFFLDATMLEWDWRLWSWVGNCFFWSVDRNSIGRSMGDFLGGNWFATSVGDPVFNETTFFGNSACGDVFLQLFDPPPGPPPPPPPWPFPYDRLNILWYQEADLEETGGAFGADGLDELDGLERHCEDANMYFFSVDPCTANRLGVSAASILRVNQSGGGWTEIATPANLGLDAGDDIDALQIWAPDISREVDINNLWVVFSLAPGSPSLTEAGTGFKWSPADLFLVNTQMTPYPGVNSIGDITGFDNRCWIHAEFLSVDPNDNIDALNIRLCDPGEGKPSPSNSQAGVEPNTVLSWTSGCCCVDVTYDVYLGTNYFDVNDANSSLPVGTSVYKGNLDVNSYDPCGLAECVVYYWRVDVVDERYVLKGNVWKFTTCKANFNCDYITNLEDFAYLGKCWLLSIGQDQWQDALCENVDVSPPEGNGIVDMNDLAVFVDHWLEEAESEDGCTITCDFNNDQLVSAWDALFIVGCYGPAEGECEVADEDCDGDVDQDDYDIFLEVCWPH